jgi:phosphohistidine phosphatase SixA
MSVSNKWIKAVFCSALFLWWILGLAGAVHTMPAQVMIIRHAEKFEDRQKIDLNPQGLTRAEALTQFFQRDPRVLQHGLPAVIIAQRPSNNKKSVRCEETVEPLAQALGQKVFNRFTYDMVGELAQWLRMSREWDSKSVLICAQHEDIVPIAKALGVQQLRQPCWPHQTYDRVWLIDFSPVDGKVISFKDIPQCLLFGDSFQVASDVSQQGVISFSQVYSETSDIGERTNSSAPKWKCQIMAEMPGDFSQFDDDTIPMLHLGGFTFGYHGTSLGKLRQNKNADLYTDPSKGFGSLRYNYNTSVNGKEMTYARVMFSWNRERLKAEFEADVDESTLTPDFAMPVECRLARVEGSIHGMIGCYLAFGGRRFHAPAGLAYQGTATTSREESDKEIYQKSLKNSTGVIFPKQYLPEL